jgi:hypothetical protein
VHTKGAARAQPPHITPLSHQLTDPQIIPPLLAPTDRITFAALITSVPPTVTFSAPPTVAFSAPLAALIPFALPAALILSAPLVALVSSTPPAALIFGFCAVHAPTLYFDLTIHLFHTH